MTSRPIRPEEVAEMKVDSFPDEVFEIFNLLITQHFDHGCARIEQRDVLAELEVRLPTLSRGDIFARGYLNVEDVYRAAGWKVAYRKPDYTETFPAYYEFRK
jgi:hypothetical protein